MKCLKCGRETGQTFCEGCLEDMDRHPVKPGTIVQLPKDRSTSYTRRNQNWQPMISLETRVEKQRQTIRLLSVTVVVLLLMLIGCCITLLWTLQSQSRPSVGQNYSTVTKATEETGNSVTTTTGVETN